MRFFLKLLSVTAFVTSGLVIALGSPASAAEEPKEAGHLPVAPWVANGQSEVVDSTTVKLQDHVNGDTSVENPSVGLNVQAGAVISVEYELMDGATCGTGEPRLFAFVNGSLNQSTLCDGAGDPATSGVLSFKVSSSGLVTQVGMVYSRDTGHVIMRNLKVDGTLVLFTKPVQEPETETTTSNPTPTVTVTETTTVTPSPSPSTTTEKGLPPTGEGGDENNAAAIVAAGAGILLGGLLLYWLIKARRERLAEIED